MQNIFHTFKLNTHHHYRHIDSLSTDAEQVFYHYFHHLLPARKPPVFLCIGTPLLTADRFGPYIGSQLKKQDIPNVFGTLEHPVHAENIEFYRNYIQKYYLDNPVVAIDASIGTPKHYTAQRRTTSRPRCREKYLSHRTCRNHRYLCQFTRYLRRNFLSVYGPYHCTGHRSKF